MSGYDEDANGPEQNTITSCIRCCVVFASSGQPATVTQVEMIVNSSLKWRIQTLKPPTNMGVALAIDDVLLPANCFFTEKQLALTW